MTLFQFHPSGTFSLLGIYIPAMPHHFVPRKFQIVTIAISLQWLLILYLSFDGGRHHRFGFPIGAAAGTGLAEVVMFL
jgi:hypothetical protein